MKRVKDVTLWIFVGFGKLGCRVFCHSRITLSGYENKGNDKHFNKLLIVKQFSSSTPKEMYREQYGEDAYWCKSIKGLNHLKKVVHPFRNCFNFLSAYVLGLYTLRSQTVAIPKYSESGVDIRCISVMNAFLVGIPIDMVGGTSMGSFVGATYAETADVNRMCQKVREWSMVRTCRATLEWNPNRHIRIDHLFLTTWFVT